MSVVDIGEPSQAVEAPTAANGPVRDRVGIFVGAALAVVVFAVDVLRLRQGWSTAFDLGVFDQAGWLLAHGHADVSIIGRHILADHVSPVLLLFALLYRIHPTALWLLGVQAVAIGSTVAPMRRLARVEGMRSPGSTTLAVVASAPLLAAAVFDFHASTLAVPAIAWMLVGARTGNRRLSLLAALAVLFCRADLLPVVVAAAFVSRREARRGLVAAILVGAVALAMPVLAGSGGLWKQDFSYLGSGPFDAAMHPWRILSGLLRPQSIWMMIAWLLPVGFLPLLKPRWMFAFLAAGGTVLLMQVPVRPWFQYGAPIVPITVGAAAAVIGERRRLQPALVAGTVLAFMLLSPVSPLVQDQFAVRNFFHPTDASAGRLRLDAVTPDDVIVAAEPVVPRLDHRARVYAFPSPFGTGGPGPGVVSAAAAARVTVVIAPRSASVQLSELGFSKVVGGNRTYVIVRRS